MWELIGIKLLYGVDNKSQILGKSNAQNYRLEVAINNFLE